MRRSKTHYLPDSVGFYSANNSESLASDLCQSIGEILIEEIRKKGHASIAVSGGSTPIPLFNELSLLNINWTKVDLTLADERWVDPKSADSNELLVRTHLIKNKASKVNFIPLKNDSKTVQDGQKNSEELLKNITLPFDVVVLGMGPDGHTASLFPCSEELSDAMDLNNPNMLVLTYPKTAPYQRICLTAKVIADSKNIFLHLNGSSKLHTLESAMKYKDSSKMPIYAFLENGLSIYWSP
ncbi:6-phosphogluconolactonase [Candidatus Pseudothioglobus sp. Uisw_050_01]|uniref:6-phosphogluconolactonase n=1 Tax=Candidatus Pseudothioglobus sp. Uisw_050_01 TaxID=3230997 RepID=UPI003A8770A3